MHARLYYLGRKISLLQPQMSKHGSMSVLRTVCVTYQVSSQLEKSVMSMQDSTSVLRTVFAAYRISFQLRNSFQAQPSPAISISASGVSIQSVMAVSDPLTPPLRILPPQFTYLEAGQSSPYPCDRNLITVTIVVNLPMVSNRHSDHLVK